MRAIMTRVVSPRPPDLIAKFVERTALACSGLPKDIAKAVQFLASDDPSFITDKILSASGGYQLSRALRDRMSLF
ncbi:SDR family oxidoreductase [Planktotalea sp.]|uniref:SDR family oxidoreductase n=1 Tax=Planktotalea sp. TaxID=2029877 RepID=UPI003F6A97FF